MLLWDEVHLQLCLVTFTAAGALLLHDQDRERKCERESQLQDPWHSVTRIENKGMRDQ